MADKPKPEQFFLLIYNLADREVLVLDYGVDADAAMQEYAERELALRDTPDVEVVMVGADSIETIKRTHSHYFARTEEELFDQFLADVL